MKTKIFNMISLCQNASLASVFVVGFTACSDDTVTDEARKSEATPSETSETSISFTQDDLNAAKASPVALFTIADVDMDGPQRINWELTYARQYLVIEIPNDAQVGDVLKHQGDGYQSELTIQAFDKDRIQYSGRIVEDVVAQDRVNGQSFVGGQVTRDYTFTYTYEQDSKAVAQNEIVILAQGEIKMANNELSTFDVQVTMTYPLPEATLAEATQAKFDRIVSMDWDAERPEMESLMLEVLNSPDSQNVLRQLNASGKVRVGDQTFDFRKLASIGYLGFLLSWARFSDPS